MRHLLVRAAWSLAVIGVASAAQAQHAVGTGAVPVQVAPPPRHGGVDFGDGGVVGASSLWDDNATSCCNDYGGCGTGGCGAGCGNWIFAVNGLYFNRDRDDNALLTFQDSDGEPLMYTRDAQMDWSAGFEARVGRYFNCGRNAIEGVYWGVFPDTQRKTVFASDAVGNLATPLQFDSLVMDPLGANEPVANYFNGAEMHYLPRSYEVQNVEINLLGLAGFGGYGYGGGCASGGCGCASGGCGCASGGCGGGCGGCGGGLAFTWLMGPRFLRFRENMLFATDRVDRAFTGTLDELKYQVDTDNKLTGFQIGGRADYCFGRHVAFYAGVKGGLYNNHMKSKQQICDGQGNFAQVNDINSPFDGEVFDLHSSKNDFSAIGELDLGMNYRITRCWSANVGYRAVFISGLALSPSQIPRDYFDNINAAKAIESNGTAVFHGAYAGATFNY